ncbi:DNA replication and repair protein RecF [Natronospira proteinivora]|uniref:DNA replication and repair protein RecF n=1 Tax=Natronospira proteinivora TaxID=1807133 RepID=A0ABT1GA92_9GAMM|nr:DNA replication/repair protein RecF [Natronospira proteinivora]MCP1728191.1 DNA replication and repair protein RecF [Natronospira proteinivora]
MTLSRLRVRDFRCFEQLDWEPGPRWTLISGENASGKTSLLEAIFFMGRGRSFRTARAERIIRMGQTGFELVGDIQADRAHRLGVRREKRKARWRLDGADLNRMTEIVSLFPVLSIDTSAQSMVEGGPEYRRRFLDWGLFHVEPSFLSAWRRYRQALSQRNGALRTGAKEAFLKTWDEAVASHGEALDHFRRAQVQRLNGCFSEMVQLGLGVGQASLEYQAGWRQDASLSDLLSENHENERKMGHTLYGPHRAELVLRVDGVPARERVSRGQQKMLAACLLLAGAQVFESERGRGVVALVDDLPSELDNFHAERLARLLGRLRGQCFITGIERGRLSGLAPSDSRLFHVEQGQLHPAD